MLGNGWLIISTKYFGRMLGHYWLMLKHQPITTKHSAKSFGEKAFGVNNANCIVPVTHFPNLVSFVLPVMPCRTFELGILHHNWLSTHIIGAFEALQIIMVWFHWHKDDIVEWSEAVELLGVGNGRLGQEQFFIDIKFMFDTCQV